MLARLLLLGPALAALASGWASCAGGPPEAFTDCDDADSRQAWLVRSWESRPAEVLVNLSGLADPTEQMVVVEALAEAFPGETKRLCEVLPRGPALERCTLLNERPHLWQIDLRDPDAGSKGSGKVFPALVPTTVLVSPWGEVEPLQAPCAPDSSANVCQTEGAWVAAQDGRVRDAARHCMGIEEGQWRYECFFQAAERAFEPAKRGRLSDALQLCLGADIYQARCMGHLTTGIAVIAPSANASDRDGWALLNRYADEARRALAPSDPGLGERFTSDLWARAARIAYSKADPLTGNPLDVVEPFAYPHVRAAAAWRLVETEGDQSRSATEWTARLDVVLAARSQTVKVAQDTDEESMPDHWPKELEGEDQIPWVPYMGTARRAIAADPAADEVICVLEAAARDSRKHARLFATALEHSDPLVRWTAARLMVTQQPSRELKDRILADPNPLVRARAPEFPK